jgi:hypothetical protein
MLLIRRSARASTAVRSASAGGELLVASVVICMVLSALGDTIDPGAIEAIGLEMFLFDFGGELSLLAMGHWHLLELVMAGVVLAGGIAVLRVAFAPFTRTPSPAPARAVDKVPIRF